MSRPRFCLSLLLGMLQPGLQMPPMVHTTRQTRLMPTCNRSGNFFLSCRRCTQLHTLTLNCAIFDHDLTLDRLGACTTIEVRTCAGQRWGADVWWLAVSCAGAMLGTCTTTHRMCACTATAALRAEAGGGFCCTSCRAGWAMAESKLAPSFKHAPCCQFTRPLAHPSCPAVPRPVQLLPDASAAGAGPPATPAQPDPQRK